MQLQLKQFGGRISSLVCSFNCRWNLICSWMSLFIVRFFCVSGLVSRTPKWILASFCCWFKFFTLTITFSPPHSANCRSFGGLTCALSALPSSPWLVFYLSGHPPLMHILRVVIATLCCFCCCCSSKSQLLFFFDWCCAHHNDSSSLCNSWQKVIGRLTGLVTRWAFGSKTTQQPPTQTRTKPNKKQRTHQTNKTKPTRGLSRKTNGETWHEAPALMFSSSAKSGLRYPRHGMDKA